MNECYLLMMVIQRRHLEHAGNRMECESFDDTTSKYSQHSESFLMYRDKQTLKTYP